MKHSAIYCVIWHSWRGKKCQALFYSTVAMSFSYQLTTLNSVLLRIGFFISLIITMIPDSASLVAQSDTIVVTADSSFGGDAINACMEAITSYHLYIHPKSNTVWQVIFVDSKKFLPTKINAYPYAHTH